MKWKNKRDKEKFKKQRDQLIADFINMDGEFKQFCIVKPPVVIEPIKEMEEEKGFSK